MGGRVDDGRGGGREVGGILMGEDAGGVGSGGRNG